MKDEAVALRDAVERHRKNEAELSNDINRLPKEQYTSKQINVETSYADSSCS